MNDKQPQTVMAPLWLLLMMAVNYAPAEGSL
jgi:hypothetical protein